MDLEKGAENLEILRKNASKILNKELTVNQIKHLVAIFNVMSQSGMKFEEPTLDSSSMSVSPSASMISPRSASLASLLKGRFRSMAGKINQRFVDDNSVTYIHNGNQWVKLG